MIDPCICSKRGTTLAALGALVVAVATATPASAQTCLGPCPAGGLNENEACVNNGNGNNAGCNVTPAVFVNAAPGQTWCGLTWANDDGVPGNANRDTDWYRITTGATPGTLSGALTSEFTCVCFIIDGVVGCAPVVIGQIGASNNCVAATAAAPAVANHTYVVFVAPGTAGGGVFNGLPCGGAENDYRVTIQLETNACGNGTCGPGETPGNCPADCPACTVSCADNEGEPCGEDENGGCNATPPEFTDFLCGTTVCGTIWASGGTRDTDWHRVAVGAGDITASVQSEVPAVTFIVDGIDTCVPAVIGAIGSSSNCVVGPQAAATVATGVYVVFVGAGNADGSGIFDGWPCGNVNTYQLTVGCVDAGPCVNAQGNCYTPHANPGCDFGPCCDAVCAADPSCCNANWDAGCVTVANATCNVGFVCGNSGNECCTPAQGPGCSVPACCEVVCNEEPFCCFASWDSFCVDLATLAPECNECEGFKGCPLGCAGTPEGEPCGDDTNGGCNGTPVAFGAIAINQTVCGTVWAAADLRDTDWLQFTVAETREVTFTVNSQIPAVAFIVDGIANCVPVVLDDGLSDDCIVGDSAVATLTPGNYVAFVSTGDANGGIFNGFECSSLPGNDGNQYQATLLSSTAPPACTLSCTGTAEPEPCGDDTNGGCNSTPPVFGAIASGQTICGTGWANGGERDTDWYLFDHAGGDATADVNAEFPAVAFFVDGIAGCVPVVVGDAGDADQCTAGLQASASLAAGEYALFVAPDAFSGIPCGIGPGGSGNFYSLTLNGGAACAGDTNGDNVVDVQDLVNVITNWNSANPGADVNDDGTVDVQDLVIVITNWGPC